MNTPLNRSPASIATRAAVALLFALGAGGARADIVATGGWSRATVPGTTTAVGYLELTNTGTEARDLLKITSPLCDKVMLHRSSVDSQGMARMWPVGSLSIKPGETIRFEPNGLHVMFMELTAPFVAGTQAPLQLQFENEKEITVMLEVRPLVPAAAPADHSKRQR
jgi:copper(I)-binding protein